jgi:conjugal transfer/entry exclusion protein
MDEAELKRLLAEAQAYYDAKLKAIDDYFKRHLQEVKTE